MGPRINFDAYITIDLVCVSASTLNPRSNVTIMHFHVSVTAHIQYHMDKLIWDLSEKQADAVLKGRGNESGYKEPRKRK